ncbi:tRNA (5-methylaminomethyl-2-thiouridine)(34)-methyltransferase MnmD [Roseibium polysiphoniae]|uniref:tRNA (5-methylaminomethyl-2-thiouridine)(34)-methyltransferase MnmD n=1 Tax=Roseibium polysiphoniae TaxID=2571221 RepID=A0ABR9C5C7_9HYPH|nr:tRNA (5-methylaminomethyl-2-thiouridine)(34)-methyltransferase MnmD [Roseibium polysiphoniae]MBD8874738.1 tRNA (5-methylaminomethyl-2-thiouridine)(34)-methyltransferase MnmD [Roseibium polysiphoniae]
MSKTTSKPPDTVSALHSAPDLEWLEENVPRASAFQDTYFSRAGGLEETRHVFLGGNGLPERWQDRETFAIAEFGFGTGLNFLTTLQALRRLGTAPKLTFLSFELFPMTKDQLERALGAFPELAAETKELLQTWAPEPGWCRFAFEGAELLLAVGDAREMVDEPVRGKVVVPEIDAWYLDGFSPSKNPELWGEELLKAAFKLTAVDGTLATYTSAGWVRRNLQTAGFAINKCKGFAGKREMAVGKKG